MNKRNKPSFILAFLTFLVNFTTSYSQSADTNCIYCSSNFRFIPGAYKTYNEFRANNPSYRCTFKVRENSKNKYGAYNKEFLEYYDSTEKTLKSIDSYAIWGYSDGVKVYRIYDGTFFQIEEIERYTKLKKEVIYTDEKGFALQQSPISSSNASNNIKSDYKSPSKFRTKNYSVFYDLSSDVTYNSPDLTVIESEIRNSLNDYDPNKSLDDLIKEYNQKNPICFSKKQGKSENHKTPATNSSTFDLQF